MPSDTWSAGLAYSTVKAGVEALNAFEPSTMKVGRSSLSSSSMIPIPCRNCCAGEDAWLSGLLARVAASIDDQLPGVLDDLAGLAELTVPRASLSVVTSAESRTLLNMVPTASGPEKLGGLVTRGFCLCEKNNGEVTLSILGGIAGFANSPRSILRGGAARVRDFFVGGC